MPSLLAHAPHRPAPPAALLTAALPAERICALPHTRGPARPLGCNLSVWRVTCSAHLLQASVDGERQVSVTDLFTGYRKTALNPNEVAVSIFIPFTVENEHVQAIKQARRRDDDIAIVTACFRVRLGPGPDGGQVVQLASLSYGGMAAVTVAAPKTAAFLTGKAWNEATLEGACDALAADLPMGLDAPGGMVEYRRSLSLSLFFKFFSRVAVATGSIAIAPREQSAVLTHDRPVSSARTVCFGGTRGWFRSLASAQTAALCRWSQLTTTARLSCATGLGAARGRCRRA